MLRYYWQDYFLFGVLSFAVMFVLFVGWTIFHYEDEQPYAQAHMEANAPTQPTPAPQVIKSKYHGIPDRFSPEFTRQMLNHMQNNATNLQEYTPPAKFFSDEFEDGFQWATTNKIKHISQCQSITKDYFEGCRTFIEIDHYINRIQVIPKFR